MLSFALALLLTPQDISSMRSYNLCFSKRVEQHGRLERVIDFFILDLPKEIFGGNASIYLGTHPDLGDHKDLRYHRKYLGKIVDLGDNRFVIMPRDTERDFYAHAFHVDPETKLDRRRDVHFCSKRPIR